MSSSIPSWQFLTAHAQPFRGGRDLAFCLKVPLDSLLVWASSEGSGETARMRRLAWTFAARIGDKYQIRLTRSILQLRNAEKEPITFHYMRKCNILQVHYYYNYNYPRPVVNYWRKDVHLVLVKHFDREKGAFCLGWSVHAKHTCHLSYHNG